MADYDKVALLALREGKILLCRKKHTTSLLILPGGKREAGESSLDCLRRELREDLGESDVSIFEYIGTYNDRAAGEPDKTVQVELYRGELRGAAVPHAEIHEFVWFDPGGDEALLAPSLRNRILPDLRRRGLI